MFYFLYINRMNKFIQKSILLFGLFILVTSFSIPFGVHAQTFRERIDSKKQQIKEKVNERIEDRCDRVLFNIDQRIDRYDRNFEKNRSAYLNIKTIVTNLISKLESRGKSVDELKNLLNEFNQLVNKAESKYSEFIEQLNNSKVYACGDSEGKFKDTVKEANVTLAEFRKILSEINAFVNQKIKPAIEKL